MKTLIQVNIEPRVGMGVEALKGRYKHHIIEFGNRFDHYENGRAVYSKHVHTINEAGSGVGLNITILSIITALLRCQITGLWICLNQPSSILAEFQKSKI